MLHTRCFASARRVSSDLPPWLLQVVGTRAEHDGGLHALTLIADSGGMSALVVPPHDLYTHKSQGLEWQAISVRSVLNNKVVGEGDCQDVLGTVGVIGCVGVAHTYCLPW